MRDAIGELVTAITQLDAVVRHLDPALQLGAIVISTQSPLGPSGFDAAMRQSASFVEDGSSRKPHQRKIYGVDIEFALKRK